MFSTGQRVIATPMARLHFSLLLFGVYYTVCGVSAEHKGKVTTYTLADRSGNIVAIGVLEDELRTTFVPPLCG